MITKISFGSAYSGYYANNFVKKRNIKPEQINQIRDIADCPIDGLKLVNVDYDKLLEIAKNQQSNITVCKHGYESFFKERVADIMNSGSNIIPTYLNISPCGMSYNKALMVIKEKGVENLDEDIFLVDFVQKTPKLDQCTAFAMREAGMKTIPFYMSESTYKIARQMGIAEDIKA